MGKVSVTVTAQSSLDCWLSNNDATIAHVFTAQPPFFPPKPVLCSEQIGFVAPEQAHKVDLVATTNNVIHLDPGFGGSNEQVTQNWTRDSSLGRKNCKRLLENP